MLGLVMCLCLCEHFNFLWQSLSSSLREKSSSVLIKTSDNKSTFNNDNKSITNDNKSTLEKTNLPWKSSIHHLYFARGLLEESITRSKPESTVGFFCKKSYLVSTFFKHPCLDRHWCHWCRPSSLKNLKKLQTPLPWPTAIEI